MKSIIAFTVGCIALCVVVVIAITDLLKNNEKLK